MDKIQEFFNTPIKSDNKLLTIIIFVVGMIAAVLTVYLLIKSIVSCAKYSKVHSYKFINIPNIICFTIVIAYFTYKDQINNTYIYKVESNKTIDTIIYIVSAILILIPLIRNIAKCKLFYGIQFSLWQAFFGLFCVSIVYAVVALVVLGFAVAVGLSSATDDNRVWLVSSTNERISGIMISSTQIAGDNGKYYYRSGEYFYDDDYNCYQITN